MLRQVATLDWIQTRPVVDRTIVEALGNELDVGDAEAIATLPKGTLRDMTR
jgi:uncharacterized protein